MQMLKHCLLVPVSYCCHLGLRMGIFHTI